MPRKRHTTRPAFSLVELVLTAMIIAVFAAIAIPRYASAVARYRLDAAARRVVADLERARSAAAARSRSVSVRFDAATDTITLGGVAGLNNGAGDATTRLADAPYTCDLVSADFGGTDTLTFNGYGKASAGGTITLRGGQAERTLTLSADTGKVSMP